MTARPHSRRHHRGATAGRAAGGPRRSRCRRCRSPAAPPRLAAAGAVRSGGFGGVAGLARLSDARAHRGADRRDASLSRRIMSANAVAAARRAGVAACSRCRGRRGARSPATLDRGGRCARRRGALGEAPRRVFLALGRKELAPFARRAAALLSGPQRRSGRDPPLPLPQAVYVTARGPFARSRRSRAAAARTPSTSWSPRTAAAARPTPRSPRRARSA